MPDLQNRAPAPININTRRNIPGTTIIKVIAVAGGIFLTWRLVNKIAKDIENRRKENLITASEAGIDLGGIAAEIYDSFYNNDFFGVTEDEIRAMQALVRLGTRKDLIPELSQIYRKLYNKILKADFITFLQDDQYRSIRYYFE